MRKSSILVCGAVIVGLAGQAWADEDEHQGGEPDGFTVVTVEPASPSTPAERTLDEAEINTLGPRSAQDLMRSLPGFQLSQHGSEGKAAQFFVRGFDAAHGTDLTLTVDGLALNEASHIHGHGYADSGLVIPEAVRRVRARTGPFELDQGNLSTAGDVEFQLGVPQYRRGLSAGVEAGWPARSRIWTVWAPREADERRVTAVEIVGDTGPFENRRTYRLGAIHQQQIGDFTLRGGAQAARFGLPGALPRSDLEEGFVERGGTYSPDTFGESAQGWVGVVHQLRGHRWTSRTSLDLRTRHFDGRENFTGFLINEERGDERREFQRGLSLALAHRFGVELNPQWEVFAYAGAGGDFFRQFEDGIDQGGEPFERERGGAGRQANIYVAPGVDAFPVDWLRLQGGLRLEAMAFDYLEDDQVGGERGRELRAIAAPRARATVYAGDQWSASLALGRGFRGPEARAVAGEAEVPADEDLSRYRGGRPEITVVDAAEFGVLFEPSPGCHLSATGFGYRSQGEFIYDHVSRLHVDLGATRRVGVELAGQLQLGEFARLRAHVSTVDGRFVDDGEPIPFAPPLEAGATAMGRTDFGLSGGLEWRAMGQRPLPFGARGGGWNLVNALAQWQWQSWEFSLHVDNLLNTDWDEGVYHYASRFDRDQPVSALPSVHVVAGHPRMVRGGISYRW